MKGRQHFLDAFFNPASVAVVGVSRNPFRINFNLFANLVRLKFPGKVYPVNPNVQEILGIKAYPNLTSIEDGVDLVVCAVPAAATLEVIKDCVEKGVKAVVIVAGGFSEIGDEGRKVEAEIAHLLRESGIRAIGPNSLSPINTSNNLVIGFSLHEKLKRGSLSFIFQSGLYEPRLEWILFDFNLGINKLIDLGNKMDINEVEALEYLARDRDTKVIAIHLESIAGDGREFQQLLRDTSKKKPVVVLKSGRTPAGSKAALSHTGAIVKGSDAVFDVALRQAGAIRAHTLEDFFDFAKAFEFLMPLKLPGNRIVIATFSGGEGVITTDLCQETGFSIANVSPETSGKLQKVAPPWAILPNPFDLGVCTQFHHPGEVYRVLLESMVNDDNVDCLAIQIGLADLWMADEFFQPFLLARHKKKPLVVWPLEGIGGNSATVQWLESNHIPVYASAERAIKALSALYRYRDLQQAIAAATSLV